MNIRRKIATAGMLVTGALPGRIRSERPSMKKFALTLIALATAIINASSNSEAQTTFVYQVYSSGPLPSVSVIPNATLVPEKPASLSALVTFQVPTDSQCTLVDVTSGQTVGITTCNWSGAAICVNPDPNTLSGGYVYPPGVIGAGLTQHNQIIHVVSYSEMGRSYRASHRIRKSW